MLTKVKRISEVKFES